DKDDKKDEDKKKDKKDKDITIDFTGIENRQVTLPIDAGRYGGMRAIEDKLFYYSSGFGGLSGRMGEQRTDLHVFDMEKREDNVFLKDIRGYDISADGKKLLYRKGDNFGIIDAGGKSGNASEGGLKLGEMVMYLDRDAEYQQMFKEAWRLQRDFFYDPNMHGVDWPAIYDRYAALVPYAAHRFDLTYIIAEMIGELSCSHTYTGGGDRIVPEASGIGLLGVDWAIDSANGRYQIGRILRGQNWVNNRRSPLTEPDINIAEGDYVLKINGQDLVAVDNPYRLLTKQMGKTVTLTVNDKPSLDGAREVTVEPIASEIGLRYYSWVEDNRRYVDSVTNGRIGYIHIPDMGGTGLNEFVRTFYPQLDKEALIIDERGNGGGFVSQLILERLRRELVGMRAPRNWDVNPVPSRVFIGPLVCLANQYSCSDGDNFPYYFKKYGLGPVIGKRTWGGVVGMRGHRRLTDGGYVRTPEFSTYNLDREWVMENYGVEPDIEVDNLPQRVIAGYDDQLIKAIEVLNEKLAEQKIELPERPDTPEER
ncbi:S41 family peptidase, partial [Candidatus Zixiibacteriota bacterium]